MLIYGAKAFCDGILAGVSQLSLTYHFGTYGVMRT